MVTAPVFSYYREAARDLGDDQHLRRRNERRTPESRNRLRLRYWHPNYSGQRKIAMELHSPRLRDNELGNADKKIE